MHDEPAPPKTWGEAWDRTKDKAEAKWTRTSTRTSSLAHRVDQKLMKNKITGNLWKKVRKPDEAHLNCECGDCEDSKEREENESHQ